MTIAVGLALWAWMLMVLVMAILLFGGLYVYDKTIHFIAWSCVRISGLWSSIRR